MTDAGARLAQAARDTLAAGPMSWTERREDHVRYLDETFGDGRALLQGIAAAHPASTCAVVVGMWAMLAGLQPRRRPPAAKAITTWAGFGGFSGKYWVPVAELVPEVGDVPYWCGDHAQGWQAATNGHVGALLEGEGWTWTTAEGGGGADGTSCRVSSPKDIRTHGGRKLRGVWRPGGKPEASARPKPSSPPPSPAPKPAPKPAPTIPAPAPDSGLLRGIDVSHHQAPGAISWARLGETHRFVFARATYGTKRDDTFLEHIRRAREVGLFVGAYHFFRPGQPALEQIDAFTDAVSAAGMGPGWLVPALDVEQNEQYDGPISAERYAGAEEIARAWLDHWGQATLYTNPSMWPAIGNPEWALECHLWISHYGVPVPKPVLGMSWAIWQNLVAPLPGVYGGQIDQNVARALPVLRAKTDPPALLPLELDQDEQRRLRDEAIRDSEDTDP